MIYYEGDSTEDSTWVPLDQFTTPRADMTAVFVSANVIRYLGQVNDPLFLASNPVPGSSRENYQPDKYFNTVLCSDQTRVCEPGNLEACPQASGFKTIQLSDYNFNEKQQATAERILDARKNANVYDATYYLGSSALMANDRLCESI
jgi:hypothetical protein